MNSGIAVSASETLWIVSASNATDPVRTTITIWIAEVTSSAAKEIFTARMPRVLEFLRAKDAVLVGPGLRDTDDSYAFVRELVAQIELPLVIDASGLNASGLLGGVSPLLALGMPVAGALLPQTGSASPSPQLRGR